MSVKVESTWFRSSTQYLIVWQKFPYMAGHNHSAIYIYRFLLLASIGKISMRKLNLHELISK